MSHLSAESTSVTPVSTVPGSHSPSLTTGNIFCWLFGHNDSCSNPKTAQQTKCDKRVLLSDNEVMALMTTAMCVARKDMSNIIACVYRPIPEEFGKGDYNIMINRNAPVAALHQAKALAYTAFAVSAADSAISTLDYAILTEKGKPFAMHANVDEPNLARFPGGVPLYREGKLIGAFAVAGINGNAELCHNIVLKVVSDDLKPSDALIKKTSNLSGTNKGFSL